MRVVTILDEILVVVVVFHYTFGLPTRLMRGHFFILLGLGDPRESLLNVIQLDTAQHPTKPW